MGVGISLPGYRPAQAGALASVLDAVNTVQSGMADRALKTEQTSAAKMQNEQNANQLAVRKQLADPESPLSQATVQSLGAQASFAKQTAAKLGYDTSPFDQVINSTSKGVGGTDQNGQPTMRKMSGLEAMSAADQYGPLFKAIESANEAALKGGPAAITAGFRADSDARSTANTYHDAMRPFVGVNNDIAKIEGILKAPVITKTNINEANLAAHRIFSPNHTSEAGIDSTSYDVGQADMLDFLRKYTGTVIGADAKQTLQKMVDDAHRVGNVTNKNASAILDNLDAGNKSLTLPGARQAAKNSSSQYRKVFSKEYQEAGSASSADHAIGTVMNGYKFRGGAWNDKKNWEPVNQKAGGGN